GVKTAFLIGPNYAAGKDMLTGVRTTFKGQVIGEELTKWPDQLDFSTELSKVRAAKPEAVFVFYPRAARVQFLTQYAQSRLKGQIPLYTAFTVDAITLPLQKDLALGVPGAQQWSMICRTTPTKSSSPTSAPSTRTIRHSTARSPTTQRTSSTARSWR